jgi:serine/threonine protein kinase
MPAPATTSDFLEICRKSGVVEEGSLSAISGHSAATPMAAAKALIRSGALTKFQAGQLLAGKYKGLRFDRLKILDRIGSGGMGTVFLCEHLGLRKQVAVKVLPPDQAGDEAVRERFFREARAAAALDHPNIVRVHDMASSGGVHYIVMEFVDGQDLQSILNKYGPLPHGRACSYIAQAALGLQHAHEKGLVHRDIKPANLLVDKTGVVKILDMGLARFNEDEKDNLTAKFDKGAVLGTADYMAPEQILASSQVDIRADIYSLGVTLYTLINGKPPFGGSCTQKLVGHTTLKATSLTQVRREVPKALSAIVDRMMAKDPAERFQTPAEVVEALNPWLELDTVPLDIQQTRKFSGTNLGGRGSFVGSKSKLPLIIAAVAISAVVFGGLGIWALTGGDNADKAVAATDGNPPSPPAPTPTPAPKQPATTPKTPSGVVQSPRDEAKLIYEIDFSKVPPFSAKFDDKKRISMDGQYPPGWWAQSWRMGAVAEVSTQEHNGRRCVVMRTNSGAGGSAELHTAPNASPYQFTPGRRYLLRTEYANIGTQNGNFELRFDGERPPVKNAVQLRPTSGEWQTADLRFTAPPYSTLGTYYTHGRGVAPDYLAIRSVQLYEYPPEAPPVVSTGPSRVVYEVDFSSVSPFRARMAKPGGLMYEDGGRLPQEWNAFVWRDGAAGEVAIEEHAGKKGIAFRTLTAMACAEISTNAAKKTTVRAGRKYRVEIEYASPGQAGGRLDLRVDDLAKPGTAQIRLNGTGNTWKTASLEYSIPPDKDRIFAAHVSNYGVGPENTFFVRWLRLTELGDGPSPGAAPGNSYELGLGGIKPFARRYRRDAVVQSQGDGSLPSAWSAQTANAETLGDVFVETMGGTAALGLRNHEGPPSLRLFSKDLIRAQGGKKYLVKLTYQTEANGKGHVAVAIEGREVNKVNLGTSIGAWKDTEVTVTAPADGGLTLAIHCDSVGSEASVFFRWIEVRELP